MPEKSDRPNHGSAMAQLLPDVSLEEDSPEEEAAEQENYSSEEEQNYSSASDGSEKVGSVRDNLSVLPSERPELETKLGPYVSDDVDQALEEVYLILRRQFGTKASKSLIVEAALRYSLSDCLKREEKSELAQWIYQVTKKS